VIFNLKIFKDKRIVLLSNKEMKYAEKKTPQKWQNEKELMILTMLTKKS
jgi:hypothetical protein